MKTKVHEPASKEHTESGGISVKRRQLLVGASVFTLAVNLRGVIAHAAMDRALHAEPFAPNAFIRVDSSGKVTIVSSYLEMGQGTFTGIATLAAEELDITPSQLEVVPAPADTKLYMNPALAKSGFKVQGTGGSTAMAGAWYQMRKAAATARAMLVTAAAQSWRVPPGELTVRKGVISHAASGRSAGYGRFVDRARNLPIPRQVALKDPQRFQLIGKTSGMPRVDVPPKVNGTATYTQDIQLPGMLVAVIAHPPQIWAKVKSVDATRAKAIPGVVAVAEVPGTDVYQGGVAVFARNTWIAKQGRDALDIVWDESTAAATNTEALYAEYEKISATPGRIAEQRGTTLSESPAGGHVIEAVYRLPYLAHAAMEPLNCVVQLGDGHCQIWNGEQWQTLDQASVAGDLGLKPQQVQITQLYAGGSFGRRASTTSDYVREAVAIAKAARTQGIKAPIKMVWMREDDMRAMHYRPLTVHNARLVLDGNGRLVSWRWCIVGQSFLPPSSANRVDGIMVEGATGMPYDIPNLQIEEHIDRTTRVPVQWLRSVGHTYTAFVGETLIDEAARRAGRDPYEFRRDMLTANPRHLAVLELAAEKAGWKEPLARGAAGEKRARGIALQEAFNTVVAHVAEVTVRSDGTFRVDRVTCAVDCGLAINPSIVEAQMQSGIGFGLSFLQQQITIENGRVVQGNFNDYPVLRMNAMPKVAVHIVPSANPPSGAGEPGVPPTAPAVLNAIAAITGKFPRKLPIGQSVRTL